MSASVLGLRSLATLLAFLPSLAFAQSAAGPEAGPTAPTAAVPGAPSAAALTPTAPALAAPADAAYQLGSGDKLRVITYGEAALTGEFVVDGSGMVSLPLVGTLRAGGLTPSAFQHVIETALANGYLKEPQVSVEVLTFRPFYILGEVSKPGTYAYSDGITVLNAVATAQGFTYRANQKRIFIKHQGEEKEDTTLLTPSLKVLPGDTIRVAERFF